MHEYLSEMLARERADRLRQFAEHRAFLRAGLPPRRPLRATVGLALIRAGRFVLRGLPKLARAESRRTA
jgi:hypothetical protein